MAVSAAALGDGLAEAVGREHVVAAPAALANLAVDGHVPRWAVRPGSVEQVSRVLTLASAERLAVVARGSGAGLGLGNPPSRLDLVLDLRRLDGVTEYVPEDMVASVEAGVTLATLDDRLARARQRLPVDPLGGQGRTVAGVLAAHESGPLRFRYGTGRDLLLGVRFVQASGAVTWGGSRVVKSVTGYDVPKLLVGSLGTLGVIVEATLRLYPVPEAVGGWAVPFAAAEPAGGFLGALLESTLQPERCVLLTPGLARAVGGGGGDWAVLVGFGSVVEAVRSQGDAVSRLAAAHGTRAVEASESAWTGLDVVRRRPLGLRLMGEPARVAVWMADLARRSGHCGLAVEAVGEAGSGVVWAGLEGAIAPASWRGGIVGPLREALAPEDGSLVIDRAPPEVKQGVDAWGAVAPEPLALMRRIKQQFDPEGVLSPGRFVGGL